MTKKDLKITIDENILQKAKKHIPNLSNFVEECLKHHLGLADGTYPIANDLDILDQISKLQVKLFLINENFDINESRKRVMQEEKNKAWRFLWNDYRSNLRMNEKLLATAIAELEKDEETLEDILEWVRLTDVEVDTNTWQDVLDKYTEYDGEW